jgi:hypothetical protein
MTSPNDPNDTGTETGRDNSNGEVERAAESFKPSEDWGFLLERHHQTNYVMMRIRDGMLRLRARGRELRLRGDEAWVRASDSSMAILNPDREAAERAAHALTDWQMVTLRTDAINFACFALRASIAAEEGALSTAPPTPAADEDGAVPAPTLAPST